MLKCIYCGCTEDNACVLADGEPCSWASESPPVCDNSDCTEKLIAGLNRLALETLTPEEAPGIFAGMRGDRVTLLLQVDGKTRDYEMTTLRAVSLGIALLNSAEVVDQQYGEALIVEPRNATLPPPHMDLLRGVK